MFVIAKECGRTLPFLCIGAMSSNKSTARTSIEILLSLVYYYVYNINLFANNYAEDSEYY